MTNQEILEKAISKAIEGGWKHAGMEIAVGDSPLRFDSDDWLDMIDSKVHIPIIYSHDFAKALWGEEEWKLVEGEGWVQDKDEVYISGIADVQPAFRMHLQQMVIADDPIEYLGANL